MLLPYALTTTQRVKDYLGITGVDSDTILEQLINRATDFFEARTNRRFLLTTFTNELYDGGRGKVFLRNYPVTVLTAFEFRVGTISSPTFQAFNDNDFILYGAAGYIQTLFGASTGITAVVADGVTPVGVQNIRVTYDAGFLIDFSDTADPAKHTLPLDIEDFVIRLVSRRFNARKADGVSQESVEGASITWMNPTSDQLSFDDKAVISKYEKKSVLGSV